MRILSTVIACGMLAACQTAQAPAPAVATDEAHDLTFTLADTMKKCWFAGDSGFASYIYSPEVVGGNPRILITPRSEPGGRPALVIEPKTRTIVETYGPLLNSPLAPRISSDLNRWKSGNTACA